MGGLKVNPYKLNIYYLRRLTRPQNYKHDIKVTLKCAMKITAIRSKQVFMARFVRNYMNYELHLPNDGQIRSEVKFRYMGIMIFCGDYVTFGV